MSERRRAFRVATIGRVALRVLDEGDEARARLGVMARSVPDMSGALGLEEGLASDERFQIKLLERMACYLNRIDRRLEELCELQRGRAGALPQFSEPLALSLSAAGLSGKLDLEVDSGTLVEVTLDLLDNSLPLIPAVASVVRNREPVSSETPVGEAAAESPPRENADHAMPKGVMALHFEAMTSVDRERIFRFATRIQRESLRARKGKEESR